MIDVLKRRRERKAWEGRARRQLDGLLVQKRAHLEVPLAGLPEQREELLTLYRRLLEPFGYLVSDLVKSEDIWTAHFEKDGQAGRARREPRQRWRAIGSRTAERKDGSITR